MKKITLIMIFLLLGASCSTTKMTSPVKDNRSLTDLKTYRANCLENKIAIDCAKYAYHIKPTNPAASVDFYKKACNLGEKNSCFNLESIERSSLEANQNLINSKGEVLYACFQDHLMKIEPRGFFSNPFNKKNEEDGKRTMNVQVILEPDGKLRSVEVPGYDSKLEGVKCMKRTLAPIHFLPNKRTQQLDYSFKVDIVPYL